MAPTEIKKIPSKHKFALGLISVCLGVLVSACICEALFRFLEYRMNAQHDYIGTGGMWVSDGRWGWKPEQGPYRIKTEEFDAQGSVNSLNMNDVPYVPSADGERTRIFVLGDSHTYAAGVSMDETWAKVLEHKLNAVHQAHKFRVYNGGVTGFNMHQYLLRLIDQGQILQPHYVVLGLSYATDLYDLLPPDRGGWIYGGERARDYFDFDSSGQLTERRWEPSAQISGHTNGDSGRKISTAQMMRQSLEYFATFRYLRRSKLALFIGSHVKVNGQTLWPNMEVILEKEISAQHEYQWRLFEALLSRINEESERQHAKLIVVGIPYIAQVYDEIWQLSFGRDPRFSRTVAIERIRSYCQSRGIIYVDTLDELHATAKQLGRWLHYRHDAHPTAEGHQVIGDTILKSGVIQPVS